MFLRTNGASRFQGVKYGIIFVMRTEQTPYFIEIHYIAHKTNLVIQNFSIIPMVSKLRDLLQTLYGYFSSSPKCHFEFTKLVKVVKKMNLKVFQNVYTRWINMFQPLKHVGKEYKTLIAKM
jgi:hypothetical protein